jgi:alpha-L-fucosidase 2
MNTKYCRPFIRNTLNYLFKINNRSLPLQSNIMKNTLLVLAMLLCSLLSNAQSSKLPKPNPLRLWYAQSATIWEEALPIGNGRLGAMVFGGVEEDHIQFNEETLWTGAPNDYAHPGASNYLGKIRELLWQGKQGEAEKLAMDKFMSVPLTQRKYQPFGDIWMRFPSQGGVSNYQRELDLTTAICRTSYQSGSTKYSREYLASVPDQTIAIALNADKKGAITFDLSLSALHEGFTTIAKNDGTIELNVKVKDGVLTGTAKVRVMIKGGTISISQNQLHIEKADQATIYLVAATSFINPKDVSGKPELLCNQYLSKIGTKKFEWVKQNHSKDYQFYFNRFSIDLGHAAAENNPTDTRLKEMQNAMDLSLSALYVQYARYLMLSSSRPGTYPANLQGIWNNKTNPPWDSKYTVNINTEMNYWAVETLNLSECHEALFKMIEEVIPSGEQVAKVHYNAKGWVLHHNTDLWRGAAPINHSNHGLWVSGGGWLSHHFWEHFLYNRDTAFLSKRAWPVLKGAAQFYKDFLVADPTTGLLVSCPSNSPETGGLVSGPTMDHEIIKSLFKICIEAAEIIHQDKAFADSLKLILPKIAPYKIGKFGQLQEWVEDVDDPNNKHRHVSHLWGVYPGNEINWKQNPELMEAAKKSLIARGDEGTGWSLAWKINFWSRFKDGDHAWNMVKLLLRPIAQTGTKMTGGGSYPNLFDAHPPFQIDGNFGGAAGIIEMLMQSHLGAIDILPALPSDLSAGKIHGLRARGGFELDFSWDKGMLSSLKVKSTAGGKLVLNYKDVQVSFSTKKGEVLTLNNKLQMIK